MSDEERERKQRAAYSAAWQELRIRHCLREAALVAHLTKLSSLRDEFMTVAGQMFDAVGVEVEAFAELRPEWPKEDEFSLAVATSDSTVTITPKP